MCVQSPIGLLKPHQLSLLIKKSQDITIGTQESDYEATLVPVLQYSFLTYLCCSCTKFY